MAMMTVVCDNCKNHEFWYYDEDEKRFICYKCNSYLPNPIKFVILVETASKEEILH